MSGQRVQQLERKALQTLKRVAEIQEAAEYYGYTSHNAYDYSYTRFKNTRTSCVEHIAIKHIQQQENLKKLDSVFNEIMECL